MQHPWSGARCGREDSNLQGVPRGSGAEWSDVAGSGMATRVAASRTGDNPHGSVRPFPGVWARIGYRPIASPVGDEQLFRGRGGGELPWRAPAQYGAGMLAEGGSGPPPGSRRAHTIGLWLRKGPPRNTPSLRSRQESLESPREHPRCSPPRGCGHREGSSDESRTKAPATPSGSSLQPPPRPLR